MKTNFNDNAPAPLTGEQTADASTPVDVISPFYGQRSLRGCVADGWRVFALKPKTYLAGLLPGALLAGVGLALIWTMVCRFCTEFLLPIRIYLQAGYTNDEAWQQFGPLTTDYVLGAAACLVGLLALLVGRACVWAQIGHYARTNSLPSLRTLLRPKSIAAHCGRLLVYNVLTGLVLLLLAVPFSLLAVSGSEWWLLAVLPFWVFVLALAVPGRNAYLLAQGSLKTALKSGLREGWHHWGGYFLIMLLTAIPLLVAAAVLLLPLAPVTLAEFANVVNLLTNEPSGMPLYAQWTGRVLAVIGFAGTFLVGTLQTWSLAFKAATSTGLPAPGAEK